MKKTLTALASLAVMVGLVGAAPAGATAPTTKGPPAVKASTRAADLSKLGNGKRLSANQFKALGLKRASRQQVARIKQLQKKSNGKATTSAYQGSTYWYFAHNAGNSWSYRFYSGPYYAYPWYPYYVIYDNWLTCTYSGTNCINAHAYTYQYLLYYYPYSTWYYSQDYSTCSPSTASTSCGGYGPYSS